MPGEQIHLDRDYNEVPNIEPNSPYVWKAPKWLSRRFLNSNDLQPMPKYAVLLFPPPTKPRDGIEIKETQRTPIFDIREIPFPPDSSPNTRIQVAPLGETNSQLALWSSTKIFHDRDGNEVPGATVHALVRNQGRLSPIIDFTHPDLASDLAEEGIQSHPSIMYIGEIPNTPGDYQLLYTFIARGQAWWSFVKLSRTQKGAGVVFGPVHTLPLGPRGEHVSTTSVTQLADGKGLITWIEKQKGWGLNNEVKTQIIDPSQPESLLERRPSTEMVMLVPNTIQQLTIATNPDKTRALIVGQDAHNLYATARTTDGVENPWHHIVFNDAMSLMSIVPAEDGSFKIFYLDHHQAVNAVMAVRVETNSFGTIRIGELIEPFRGNNLAIINPVVNDDGKVMVFSTFTINPQTNLPDRIIHILDMQTGKPRLVSTLNADYPVNLMLKNIGNGQTALSFEDRGRLKFFIMKRSSQPPAESIAIKKEK